MNDTILVTGGAGFIGSHFVLQARQKETPPAVVTLDVLSYAGTPLNLAPLDGDPQHTFVEGDIRDRDLIRELLGKHAPRAVVHFAAESHVDRSITGSRAFLDTNIMGTHSLLEEARAYWQGLGSQDQDSFRFVHVSTDEVYGALGMDDPPFTENTPMAPNSPYAASKAASDHVVRAWHQTFGLPTITTHCSNNYGPHQVPEKLIPVMIDRAATRQSLPIYGNGQNVRDWIHVTDHCRAVHALLEKGNPGEVYNIGADDELSNLALVEHLCTIFDRVLPPIDGGYKSLMTFVKDRLGHDFRYAIDSGKVHDHTGWRPTVPLAEGLEETVRWYLDNDAWLAHMRERIKSWTETHYSS